jgi:nucleoside-diphosphate-sugar epimerase
MAKLIFGCGYLGLRVARLWLALGEEVYAVTRSAERAAQLASEGIRPLVGNLVREPKLPLPARLSTVLFAVGFDRQPGAAIHEVYVGGLANAISSLPRPMDRFVYISSTGVYGQTDGEEVDEDSVCQPVRDGGRACLAGEELLAASHLGKQAVILRLAGLYGPGRIPRSGDLKAGRPIDAPSGGWLNLIHVEDAARIVLLTEARASPPRTYVISDGHPVQRADYFAELSRLLDAPPPRFVDPPPASAARQRAASDKRVNPRRMFAKLQPRLLYPSYRAGLAAIVADESAVSRGRTTR